MSRQASGLQAWALQRLTAVYIGLYLLYLLLQLLLGMPSDHAAWHSWFTGGVMSVATFIAILSLLLHSWIGVRDVIIDYIKPAPLKIMLLALVLLYLAGCGIWAGKLLLLAELGSLT